MRPVLEDAVNYACVARLGIFRIRIPLRPTNRAFSARVAFAAGWLIRRGFGALAFKSHGRDDCFARQDHRYKRALSGRLGPRGHDAPEVSAARIFLEELGDIVGGIVEQWADVLVDARNLGVGQCPEKLFQLPVELARARRIGHVDVVTRSDRLRYRDGLLAFLAFRAVLGGLRAIHDGLSHGRARREKTEKEQNVGIHRAPHQVGIGGSFGSHDPS